MLCEGNSPLRKVDIKRDIFSIADTTFKECLKNHTRGFRHKKYVNSTEHSNYMQKLKGEKIAANVK